MTARHRAQEFLRFLKLIDASVPEHLGCMLCWTTRPPTRPRRAALAGPPPRFVPHFTPSYSSWLNLVERRFAELTTKWLRRGTHRSVRELIASIRTWITNWYDEPRPFVWHKTADEILASLATYCQRVTGSGTSVLSR
jgi:transposase